MSKDKSDSWSWSQADEDGDKVKGGMAGMCGGWDGGKAGMRRK